MNNVKDKVVIITGGARGIGFSAAETFAKQGAQVVIWDINESQGNSALKLLKDNNLNASFYEVNVTKFDNVSSVAKAVIEKYGKIDVLINNAGITRDARLVKMTPEEWQQVIDVNLTGVFNCTKAVSEYMISAGSGRIINTSSVVGLYGNFGQSNYVATKSGVIGLTKVWARELGPKGITVNAVAPGFIATEMVNTIPEKVINMITEKTPLRRMGKPEDIANAYLFLSGDGAAFINGTTLSVDGGITL